MGPPLRRCVPASSVPRTWERGHGVGLGGRPPEPPRHAPQEAPERHAPEGSGVPEVHRPRAPAGLLPRRSPSLPPAERLLPGVLRDRLLGGPGEGPSLAPPPPPPPLEEGAARTEAPGDAGRRLEEGSGRRGGAGRRLPQVLLPGGLVLVAVVVGRRPRTAREPRPAALAAWVPGAWDGARGDLRVGGPVGVVPAVAREPEPFPRAWEAGVGVVRVVLGPGRPVVRPDEDRAPVGFPRGGSQVAARPQVIPPSGRRQFVPNPATPSISTSQIPSFGRK